ncbi:MAG: stage V sporulation protein AC [Eubacteriales bacterium]|mgnify:CR=1 FL=1|jgi:stage V sporulation protein AC|nr:stage V sporulation protein AC [Eubacteriales bacterium]MDY5694202.1 stage V sporulation protein AC [Eubacteriales bacterium]HZK45156.1 stage V sporulation protein AC [Clostridia bacterium]
MKKERIPSQKEKDYQRRVNEKMPKSKTFLQCVRAFISGGIICCIGQLIHDFAKLVLNFSESNVAAFTAIVLVFLGATLTGIGVYDNIGSWAGAGSVVPITGFANSIVSPAMEFKREGYVLGLGAKMFSIAGPVLVYGISASVLVGLIACLISGKF